MAVAIFSVRSIKAGDKRPKNSIAIGTNLIFSLWQSASCLLSFNFSASEFAKSGAAAAPEAYFGRCGCTIVTSIAMARP